MTDKFGISGGLIGADIIKEKDFPVKPLPAVKNATDSALKFLFGD